MSLDLINYTRRLPHQLPPGHTLFITFRLAGSLPAEVLLRLREEKLLLEAQAKLARAQGHADNEYVRQRRWFAHYDQQLHYPQPDTPTYLHQPAEAAIVTRTLHFYHERQAYDLLAYCIMPNHIHLVVRLPDDAPVLALTLKKIKSYTARQLNTMRGAAGQVWQKESYDHRVRNAGELGRIISYVLENPVKAGLCAEWQEWPHSYLADY